MKKFVKMIGTVTVMCLLMASLAACGKKDKEKESSGNIQIKETQSEAQTESETAIETVDETKPPFEETKPAVTISVPAEVDTMRPILLGICKTMSGGRTYDGSDSAFFWDGIYAAINGGSWIHPDISMSDDGSGYMVPRETLAEYAEAMFAGNSAIPEIPSTMGGIEFDVDSDCYILYSSEGYLGSMEFTEIEETDNGYEATVAFTTKSGNVETHTFIMTSGGYGTFPCAVNAVIDE